MISQPTRHSSSRCAERLRWLVATASRSRPCCLIAAFLLALPAAVGGVENERGAFLSQYCLTCHSGESPAGGLALAEVDSGTPEGSPDVWERVIRKLAAREMPPPGAPHPGEAASEAFRQGLIKDLDAAAGREPYAGRTVIRRLNRTEYANAIRDILALEVSVADRLPPDGQAAGFDNIADALAMSPLLLEGYLKAARQVSQLAVGVSDPSPVIETYPATGTQGQWQGEGIDRKSVV